MQKKVVEATPFGLDKLSQFMTAHTGPASLTYLPGPCGTYGFQPPNQSRWKDKMTEVQQLKERAWQCVAEDLVKGQM